MIGSEVLLQLKDVAAAEVLDLHSWLTSRPLRSRARSCALGQLDLQVVVLAHAILHDDAVQADLQVTLVGVDDDVHAGFLAKALLDDSAEDILQDAHHGHPVDVLEVLEFSEGLDEVHGAHGTMAI
jgi:hypothetical protein